MFGKMLDMVSFLGIGPTVGFLIATFSLTFNSKQPCNFDGNVYGLDKFIQPIDTWNYPNCMDNWNVQQWIIVGVCVCAGFIGPKIGRQITQ